MSVPEYKSAGPKVVGSKVVRPKFVMLLVLALPGLAAAQVHREDQLEEIVVTAAFEASEAETSLPIGILTGEALREKVGNSLGDTLRNEIGVSNASFGASVGQPVIRGQSGNRVSILQNGVGLTDASNVSPDHANGVEPALAERLEVLRGPSALLYGSGAIGGVVNVIDGRIPETLRTDIGLLIEQSHNTVSDENKTVARFDTSANNLGFHLDMFQRSNGNVEISGPAINEANVEALEELVAARTGIVHAEEGEAFNSNGYIANSDGEANGGTVGMSLIGDAGFIGFSLGQLNNEYGLPPGTHGHHDEEPLVVDPAATVEDGPALVRLDMEQSRYDLKGQLDFAEGWIDSIKGSVGFTDYQHREIEIEPDGAAAVGTVYSNEGLEGRFTLNHEHDAGRVGVWGMQFANTRFSALGDEAFIPVSDINTLGLFGVERFQRDRYTGELGLRVERNQVDPSGVCETSNTSTSLSGSVLYDINPSVNLLTAVTRSQRAPSVEELYSNVSSASCARFVDEDSLIPHAATGLLEIGNPLLGRETSRNFELGLRRYDGAVTGEISAYYNRISDYVYLDISGEEVAGQAIASYQAQDALFQGLEAELSIDLSQATGANLILNLFGDLVRAEFDSGGLVPRIPPAKLGAELRYFGENWSMHVHATRVMDQDRVGELEIKSSGFTQVSIYGDYHWSLNSRADLKLFFKADNLLDEEIRNHASFLKDYAPEPGRGYRLGVRLEY
jgi:iron complex outermembrane recepter protein